jgi:hypothetical protein
LPNSYRSILESTFEEPVAPGKHFFICETCAASCVKAQKYTSALKDLNQLRVTHLIWVKEVTDLHINTH